MMNLSEVLRLARKHVDANPASESSARFCLAYAVELQDSMYDAARGWALKSLKHSLGILSPIYQKAAL